MQNRTLNRLALAALVAIAPACGGGGAATSAGPVDTGGANTPAFASLNLSPPTGTVPVLGTLQLAATPVDATGSPVAGLPAATFSSSDDTRASVDGAGVVTGKTPGPVTITATLTASGVTKTATASLTVTGGTQTPVLASLAVDPPSGSVAVGGQLQLTATPLDGNGLPLAGAPAASWTTSDASRARISGGVVTGVAAGSVTITASVTAGGVTKTATAAVTVTAPQTPSAPMTATVQGLEDAFSPSAVTIAVGGTVTWTMSDDEEHDVTFSGTTPPGGSIPRIDKGESASRTFTAAGTYAYHCERHDGDETGTVVVQAGSTGNPPAQNPVLTSLSLSPSAPTIAVGGTVQLTATPRDQNGAAMAGLPAASFTTSDATRATVSATGVVTGVAAGTATITAGVTSGGVTRTATATVTVGGTTTTPPTGPSTATVQTPGVTFSPQTVTIAAGGTVTWQISGTRHNVTFNGAAPTGGSIPDTDEGRSVSRTFPATGVYDYVCTRHSGMTGRVVVQ